MTVSAYSSTWEGGSVVETAPAAEFFTAPRSQRAVQFLNKLNAGGPASPGKGAWSP